MFSKQVWHDRRHQIEVFRNEAGCVIGTIASCRRGIVLINPRTDILVALYQEAKIRRIASINTVVLTTTSPEHVRGLCGFLGYSRELTRRKQLEVRFADNPLRPATPFINSCCMQLMTSATRFALDLGAIVPNGSAYVIGDAELRLRSIPNENAEVLDIRTPDRRIVFADDRLDLAASVEDRDSDCETDVVIRAANELPQRSIATAPKSARLVFAE